MKLRLFTTAAAGLLFLPAAWSQTRAAADPIAGKVAVLNVQVAISSTVEGKQASAELQAQFAPRQAELEDLNKKIEDVRRRLQTGTSALSDEEKARLAREGDQLTRSLQRKQQDLQDDGQEAQREALDRIGRKMIQIIDRYAKENGYSMVVDNSSQNSTILYAAPQIEITQEIIRLYDQSYPGRAAATPAQPRSTSPRSTAPSKPAPQQKPPQ